MTCLRRFHRGRTLHTGDFPTSRVFTSDLGEYESVLQLRTLLQHAGGPLPLGIEHYDYPIGGTGGATRQILYPNLRPPKTAMYEVGIEHAFHRTGLLLTYEDTRRTTLIRCPM